MSSPRYSIVLTTSPNRRVLSDKSTNASISTQSRIHSMKRETQILDDIKPGTATSPLRAGTKRSFEDLESNSQDTDDHNEVRRGAQPRAKPETDARLAIEETEQEPESLMSSMIDSNSTTASSSSLYASTNTVLTSFHASQEISQPIEEQFEIVQEESQRTLEQIHATPMPEPQLSLLPPERSSIVTEDSQDSIRLSSFIEFDDVEDTQQGKTEEDMEMITALHPAPILDESLETKHILEKATMLRTRLQLAMHKVETNQTCKPFSRLEKPKSASPRLSVPPRLFAASILPNEHTDGEHAARLSPESQIAIHRARAFRGAYQSKAIQRLNSLPVPKIVPTAYSSRYMIQPQMQQIASQHQLEERHSSLPASHGTDSGIGSVDIRRIQATPSPVKTAGTKALHPETPQHQLNIPPKSDDGDGATKTRDLRGTARSALMSSVGKGEAANGLLELMRAGSR